MKSSLGHQEISTVVSTNGVICRTIVNCKYLQISKFVMASFKLNKTCISFIGELVHSIPSITDSGTPIDKLEGGIKLSLTSCPFICEETGVSVHINIFRYDIFTYE